MAMKGTDFLKLTEDEILEIAHLQTCGRCKQPLRETITGRRKVGYEHVCSDCYFEEFGRELERNPIFVPRKRMGG
jgi:hypothetical protein